MNKLREMVIEALAAPFDWITVVSFFMAAAIVLIMIWPRHQ
jgi:hypothetical protein